jgi:hypothetical protein
MRSASRALEETHLKLEEAESGRITPPAPRTISMAEYYRQSELDYAEAMVARRELEETCKRLEAITSEKMSKSHQRQQLADGSGDAGSAPRPKPLAGPKKSVLLSPRSMKRQQSHAAASDDALATGPALAQSSRAQAAVGSGFDPSDGVESLSDALLKIDRIRAVLAATRMTAPVNPYSNSAELEEAEKRNKLRPHTVALLGPLSFEDAAQPTEFDRTLREAQELLRVQHAKASEAAAEQQKIQEAQRSAYRRDLEEWRSLEEDQLALVHRHGVERCYSESEYWTIQNQRNKNIMDKVNEIHRKANMDEAAKLHARESLAKLSRLSEQRVAVECLVQQELCIRKCMEAAERAIFEESVRIPQSLLKASTELLERSSVAGSPLKSSCSSPARLKLF